MKLAKLYLMMLLAIIGIGNAAAGGQVFEPYSVDFNTEIITTQHDFAVSEGWGHIVGTYNYDGQGPYYMTYIYKKASEGLGINGSGTLLAYSQWAGEGSYGSVVNDVLITPLLEGTVTIFVKASSYASEYYPTWVELYAVNDLGNTLGSLLKKFTTNDFVASTEYEGWSTITLTLTTATRVGIRAQHVYLDNLSASKCTIVDPVETVTFTYEYTSFSSKSTLDFSTIDNVKVYIATEKLDGITIIEEVTTTPKKIPSGVGVILQNCGDGNTYDIPVIPDIVGVIPNNILIGTADEAYTVTTDDVGYVYRLVYGIESKRCGFQKAKAGQTVSQGKAYLRLSKAGAAEFIGFEDTTDIIDLVTPSDENAPMYDLTGSHVNESYKGIIIQNGVKRVRK